MRIAKTQSRWTALGVAAAALGGLATGAHLAPALALINESPSLPRGVYARLPDAEIRRGSTVAIAQPEPARPYLSTLGMPPRTALIKRVAAVGGDRICVGNGRVSTPVGERPVFDRDSRGVALPVWSGCRRLRSDEVFLLGDTAGSFDSRYFGPVRRAEVMGSYREVLTW